MYFYEFKRIQLFFDTKPKEWKNDTIEFNAENTEQKHICYHLRVQFNKDI